ncbi:hypothetical protein QR685DRAFT_513957, partial [Neurospora intermedia]
MQPFASLVWLACVPSIYPHLVLAFRLRRLMEGSVRIVAADFAVDATQTCLDGICHDMRFEVWALHDWSRFLPTNILRLRAK